MERVLKGFILLTVIGIFAVAVALGFLLIISGGNPVDFVRSAVIRVSIASRTDEIYTPIGTNNTPIRFTINSGDTPATVANNLYQSQLITDAELFVNYLRSEQLDTKLEAGIFFLNQTQNMSEIASILQDSRSSIIRFRIVEGSRIEEVAESIDAVRLFSFSGAEFLTTVQAGATLSPNIADLLGIPHQEGVLLASLEGFLFPDTYVLAPDISAVALRDELLLTFINKVGQQLIIDSGTQGYTMRQMVTLASIVEREAVWDDEHALIASVYRNRLNIDMLLQADPTIQYALNGTRGKWWVNITQADYTGVISPYNTYLNKGLPPSPIANPSLSAILGTIYPAESSYFYFRARCDGSYYHNFATTYSEHLANGCR